MEKPIRVLLFTVASILAGYIIADFPPAFLDLFTTPVAQLLIILAIVSSFYNLNSKNWRDHVKEALSITILVFGLITLLKQQL